MKKRPVRMKGVRGPRLKLGMKKLMMKKMIIKPTMARMQKTTPLPIKMSIRVSP